MDQSMEKTTSLGTEEILLQEYSPERQQEVEIDHSNSALLFTPEFIPFYSEVQREFGLTHIETIIYGFIRYYSRFASNRFYFTDKQLSYIANCSESAAGRAVNKLRSVSILDIKHKIKANGGKVRFVKPNRLISDSAPDRSRLISDSEPLEKRGKENKINKNKYLKRIEFSLNFSGRIPPDIEAEIRSNKQLTKWFGHLLKDAP